MKTGQHSAFRCACRPGSQYAHSVRHVSKSPDLHDRISGATRNADGNGQDQATGWAERRRRFMRSATRSRI